MEYNSKIISYNYVNYFVFLLLGKKKKKIRNYFYILIEDQS